MILGIGIDLVEVKRMQRWVENPAILEKYFSGSEQSDILAAGAGAARSAAARFAAKEAFGKALGCGLAGFALSEVSVEKNSAGKPGYRLTGKALEKLKQLGGGNTFLSLTHEKEIAAAVAVIEAVPSDGGA